MGVWRAIARAWVCDDSFISLRYAENLVSGHGLVYNVGERVEGYSNLLWTLLVALWMRLGFDPIRAAQAMGIASYLLLALLLAAWSWRRARATRRMALPLAALVVLVADDFQVWATGGLETMLFALAGVAAILLTRLPASPLGDRSGPPDRIAHIVASRALTHCLSQRSARRDWGAGALLAMLALLRPDGLLYAPPALVSLWIATPSTGNAARARAVARAVVPLALTLAVLVAWKLSFYSELLPTAFYSKSAASPYYLQGLRYLGLYLVKSWYLVPALIVVPWLARASDRPAAPGGAAASERNDRLVFLATAGFLAAYVLHSGGDFMFARRLVPIAPFLLLALESWLVSIERRSLQWTAALVLIAAAALPYPVFGEGRWRIEGIADEPHFYPPEAVATRREQGERLGALLDATPARVMFEGGMCMFAYYSKLPYLVEMTGLTQYSLARLPLAERGLIGHEKQPDDHWLDQHDIHLVVAQEWPIAPPPPDGRRHDELYVDGLVKARIRIYSDAVMDPLRGRPEVSFVPIEQVVERLRGEMEAAPFARASAIHDYLDRYYLRSAGARGAAIEVELQALLDAKRKRDAGE